MEKYSCITRRLDRFIHMTHWQVIVMGRKTFESLPNGQLKDRIHIVITRTPETSAGPNVVFVNMENLGETIELYKTQRIFVIGGRNIRSID